MEFKDFQLEIDSAGVTNTYEVRVDSPFMGPIESTFEMPFDEIEFEGVLRDMELAVLKGTGRRRSLVPEQQGQVKDFGEKMFSAIFTGDIGASYRDAVRRARDEGKGLRIRLTTKATELAAVPWEFLSDPESSWVVLNTQTPLVRHMRTTGGDERLEVDGPLRILGMIASPDGMAKLDVDAEKERITQALGDLITDGTVEIAWTDAGTWRDLQNAMREGPWHILHFIGHGGFDSNRGVSVLAFEREGGGNYRPIEPEQLSRLIQADDDLRLVVLNACEGAKGDDQDALSSTAAYLVKNAAPAVLAMQWEISDEAALEFSRTFYSAVAAGSAVDAAVGEARVGMSMDETSLEWATPVLFMRSPDGVLFEVSARPVKPVVTGATGLFSRNWKLGAGILGSAAVVALLVLLFSGNNDVGPEPTNAPVVVEDTSQSDDEVDEATELGIVIPASPRLELPGHAPKSAVGVSFSPDGSLLASAGFDGTVRVWDVETGSPEATFSDHVSVSVEDVVFLDENKVASTGCLVREGTRCVQSEVLIWSIEPLEVIRQLLAPDEIGETDVLIGDIDASDNGSLLAGSSRDQIARIWDTESGELLQEFPHPVWVEAVAFDRTGEVLATGSGDRSSVDTQIRLWNVKNGTSLDRVFKGHPEWVTSVDFSPTESLVGSGGFLSETFLWRPGTGSQVGAPLETPDIAFVVAFGPSGEILATGDSDDRVRLWSVSSHELLGVLEGHEGGGAVTGVHGVAFSPDGRTMASTGSDGAVFIWVYRD